MAFGQKGWRKRSLHPVTSSPSEASEVEREETEANRCHHLQLPIARRPSIVIPGLEACGWTSFHGFTTYWMIKKAPSCTVHCVENTASDKKDGVGQCTVLTVSAGEADQTSEIPIPQLSLEVQECQQQKAVLG